ncbi:MAG: MFS transporter [Pseudomonadota bacterium]
MFQRFRIALAPGQAPWLGAGYLLCFSSSFGQTFFIALSGAEIRALLDLSHGDFGALYAIATGVSALLMTWAGAVADRPRLAPLTVVLLCGLAVACLLIATTDSIWQLLLAVLLLRLFGQGLLSHVAMTAMARWFDRQRGRAIAVASLGYPTGEALLPSLAVFAMVLIGWRGTWIAAAILLLALAPLLWRLLRNEPRMEEQLTSGEAQHQGSATSTSWTRGQVLRDPLFYLLLPGVISVSFMVTAILFHQALLVEVKGWSLAWFAAAYPFNAVTVVVMSLIAGWLVDRFGARRLLGPYLLPMACAFLLLSSGSWPGLAPLFMFLAGLSVGSGFVILGALWAEIYGTRHLGAIRGLAFGAMVAGSAGGPVVMGWLYDQGVSLDLQLQTFAIYLFGNALLFSLLVLRHPRLAARATSG